MLGLGITLDLRSHKTPLSQPECVNSYPRKILYPHASTAGIKNIARSFFRLLCSGDSSDGTRDTGHGVFWRSHSLPVDTRFARIAMMAWWILPVGCKFLYEFERTTNSPLPLAPSMRLDSHDATYASCHVCTIIFLLFEF